MISKETFSYLRWFNVAYYFRFSPYYLQLGADGRSLSIEFGGERRDLIAKVLTTIYIGMQLMFVVTVVAYDYFVPDVPIADRIQLFAGVLTILLFITLLITTLFRASDLYETLGAITGINERLGMLTEVKKYK
jgi:hypothetical protein